MTRRTTSLKIDNEIWKEVKKHCITNDLEISCWLESIIIKELELGGY